MEEKTTHLLTERETGVINSLVKLGQNRNVITVIVYLIGNGASTSREIEQGTTLRQPEVSKAVSHLINKGWIYVTKEPNELRKKMVEVYSTAKGWSDIICGIREEIAKRQEQEMDTLANLEIEPCP